MDNIERLNRTYSDEDFEEAYNKLKVYKEQLNTEKQLEEQKKILLAVLENKITLSDIMMDMCENDFLDEKNTIIPNQEIHREVIAIRLKALENSLNKSKLELNRTEAFNMALKGTDLPETLLKADKLKKLGSLKEIITQLHHKLKSLPKSMLQQHSEYLSKNNTRVEDFLNQIKILKSFTPLITSSSDFLARLDQLEYCATPTQLSPSSKEHYPKCF